MPDHALLTALYTLTPTHCGTGQAMAAVDLPIVREQHTRLPLVPATSLKGVARDLWGPDERVAEVLFGPKVESGRQLHAGALVLHDGQLLAFPARSLNRPFVHVTSHLLIERFARLLRALGLSAPPELRHPDEEGRALVADAALARGPLVVEDLIYESEQVLYEPSVGELARWLACLLPEDEPQTRRWLERGLVLLPDMDLCDLVERATPVQARVKLTAGKTTDKYLPPDGGKLEKGNLWYEETLPPDCLFGVLVERRAQHRGNGDQLGLFAQKLREKRTVQIGGNETVGQGRCLWHAVSLNSWAEASS
ncbi:MAG: type III-B CRISPR module RAMP protein Cmr4 [Myxococcales bacterium]|nr:type III-B CRISPR module RAMP protein Cmr4 [Myxococcota bacterium]MDW8283216.1 type III-B CRISPR module RAMP protein Cmr4 [Myxococcales bacterium]